jgi:phospholipid/cholesterol/gamma-HCH transport system permease protein
MEHGPLVSFTRDESGLRIHVGGRWRMGNALPPVDGELREALDTGEAKKVHCVLRGLESWDTSLLAFLVRVENAARAHAVPVSYEGLPSGLRRLLDMVFSSAHLPAGDGRKATERDGFLVRLGALLLAAPEKLGAPLRFQGELVLSFWRLLRGKSDMRLDDVFGAAMECGLRALPIIMLTGTLFGTILAFMGAVQLVRFGAQVYVAALVGIAMLRVMGAVLVGVVMSGRTGASYAANIGSMQVNEEVDALIALGISPMDYLVLPRVLALSLMVPLLTLYADIMGIVGGFLVGIFMLDLSPHDYYLTTIEMVSPRHLFVGLVYAAVFGVIVALCGCYQGLNCGRSAEGVGKAATTAVVSAIVCIIAATAVITVFCNMLNV